MAELRAHPSPLRIGKGLVFQQSENLGSGGQIPAEIGEFTHFAPLIHVPFWGTRLCFGACQWGDALS